MTPRIWFSAYFWPLDKIDEIMAVFIVKKKVDIIENNMNGGMVRESPPYDFLIIFNATSCKLIRRIWFSIYFWPPEALFPRCMAWQVVSEVWQISRRGNTKVYGDTSRIDQARPFPQSVGKIAKHQRRVAWEMSMARVLFPQPVVCFQFLYPYTFFFTFFFFFDIPFFNPIFQQ